MTGNDAIPITLPAEWWRYLWRVLKEDRYQGRHSGVQVDEPVHCEAFREIECRGLESNGDGKFTCVLRLADVACIAMDLSGTEYGDELRRQLAPYMSES